MAKIPSAVQSVHEMRALIPDGIFVGTSLILRQGDRFLYGLRPPKTQGDNTVLELTGIGGGMEVEDLSLTAGARREAREEIGCDVRPVACASTLVVRGPQEVEKVAIVGRERPVALAFRNYRTPPRQPWHVENQGNACLVVFFGELLGQPFPVRPAELPQLVWLTAEEVLAAGTRDVPMREVMELGAELVLGNAGRPPAEGLLRLTDSQEALAVALGGEMVGFYESLGQ